MSPDRTPVFSLRSIPRFFRGGARKIGVIALSFGEFMCFHGFEIRDTPGAPGGAGKAVHGKTGETYGLGEGFDAYMRYGGMPGIADIGPDRERVPVLPDGICSAVTVRDIPERERRRGRSRITDPAPLRKICLFLADSIGSSVSVSSVRNTLVSAGMLRDSPRKGMPSTHTAQAYVSALTEACFFCEEKRPGIGGKDFLRTLGKYHIADMGLRNSLPGFRGRERIHALGNAVCFELPRRGYDVAVGKIGDQEVDFVAAGPDGKLYVQVAETMQGEDVRIRELAPLRRIGDSHEKVVLSLRPGMDSSYDGIRSLDLIDWLASPPKADRSR